jgi:uncharacterized protein YdeI (YjbR/CyaY-like superfamily)
MAALDVPQLLLPDAHAWRQWLGDHHADATGIWLVLHKKGGAVTELTYEQALQEALCFGWIDGQVAKRDEGSYLQRFTPRRSKSPWSKSNVDRIAVLLAEGRMTPAGQSAVDAAKADGRWERAYAGAATAQVPADLAAAIAAVPGAASMFAALDAANRYALIYRVNEAKREETRSRRIEKFVAMLARGETIHPQRSQR